MVFGPRNLTVLDKRDLGLQVLVLRRPDQGRPSRSLLGGGRREDEDLNGPWRPGGPDRPRDGVRDGGRDSVRRQRQRGEEESVDGSLNPRWDEVTPEQN